MQYEHAPMACATAQTRFVSQMECCDLFVAGAGNGCVATGSKDGQVRLSHPGKEVSAGGFQRAKTSIPGLGSPITAIDVTYDGHWVLATSDKYLMIIRATFFDDSRKEINAFETAAANSIPKARLLRLRHEDNEKTVRALAQVKMRPCM